MFILQTGLATCIHMHVLFIELSPTLIFIFLEQIGWDSLSLQLFI